MPEWWTYRLSDFLMFTSETYFRLFELSNRAWWPLQLVFLASALLTIYYLARRYQPTVLSAAGILFGFVWLWLAWEFHWVRYAPIMLAAPYFAAGFVLQGTAMALGSRFLSSFDDRTRPDSRLGLALLAFGLLIQPLLGLPLGYSVAQFQYFGIAPDPTVTATIGFLFFIRAHWSLFVVPLLWCAVTSATLSALEVIDTWIMLTVGLVTIGGLLYRKLAR